MNTLVIKTVALIAVFHTANAINCYVCNSTDSVTPFQCGEWFDRYDTPDLQVEDCSKVHGAKYCIKHIGRFEATAIKCYQCSSANTIDCSDLMINQPDAELQPQNCSHVIDAQYCIKSTALNGGIGAKRFCSSKDLGNYCDYVMNKGDRMEYRSCIFTCGSDGCNPASKSTLATSVMLVTPLVIGAIKLFG